MHRLSILRHHAAVVLTLFVMALGAMSLAPLVRPAAMQLVCSANGSRFVDVDVAGAASVDGSGHSSHADPGAHCPLCMPAGAPPGTVAWDFAPVQPRASVRQGIPAARLASLVGAPLPARGPPVLS